MGILQVSLRVSQADGKATTSILLAELLGISVNVCRNQAITICPDICYLVVRIRDTNCASINLLGQKIVPSACGEGCRSIKDAAYLLPQCFEGARRGSCYFQEIGDVRTTC